MDPYKSDVIHKLRSKNLLTRLYGQGKALQSKTSWFRNQGPHQGQSYIQASILVPYKVLKMIRIKLNLNLLTP
jgi:hypothetical protein